MATVADGYPLYYEAANEHGLAVAGLNFPGFAHYFDPVPDKDNIAPFEFVPWILSQCKNLSDAREMLKNTNLCSISFSEALPLSPLHWMISDREETITVDTSTVLWTGNITTDILEVNTLEHVKINSFIIGVNGCLALFNLEELVVLKHSDYTV
jgi:hypothetical protein